MSWNGFFKRMSTQLVKNLSPNQSSPNQTNPDHTTNETSQLPKIWLQLPFIGKRGKLLIRKFKKKLTTATNCFLSSKEKTPKQYQSSVVYSFSCPGCLQSYIGKTDRCLYTRIKEHATCPNSEVHNHINSCEQFQHLEFLMDLSPDDQNSDETLQISLVDFIFNNCAVIDKADHWLSLLFKEALAIRRQKPQLTHGTKASWELTIFY